MSTDAHGGTTHAEPGLKQPFHLVDPSPWPFVASWGAFLTVLGIVFAAHGMGWLVLIVGLLAVLFVMFVWWRDVLRESRTPGVHTSVVRLGLRYGMIMFIASEVMFFVGFFWSWFNFAFFPENVADAGANATWPPAGQHTFDPWHLPMLNTMILLLSGTTVTWAHHGLLEGNRKVLVQGLALTVLLGLSFTGLQAIEYATAPFKFWDGNVYSSVFYLATGFHGFHVIVGTCFLLVCLIRAMKGHFTPDRHFGFEAAAWYWHFVDVVWLFLFVCIYWLGQGIIAAH